MTCIVARKKQTGACDMKLFNTFVIVALLLAPVAATAAESEPVGTTFTYQGRLMHKGEPHNGPADLLFTLWDAEMDGAMIGSPNFLADVLVNDGLFTVLLNFGNDPAIFDGSPRWLQVHVNDVQLTTRQMVTPVPHALYAEQSTGAIGDFVLHSSEGGMPAKLHFGTGGPSIGSIGSLDEVGIRISDPLGDPIAILGKAPPDNGIPMIKIAPVSGPGALAFGEGENGISLNFMPSAFAPPTLNFKGGFIGIGLADGMASTSGIQLPMTADNPIGAGLATAWNTYSSIRWKENVQTIPDALEKVLALRGVEFDWKHPDKAHGLPFLGVRDIGFIAEDVAEIVPELVIWEEGGAGAKGMKYDRITALAVEAIKQQQDHIEALAAENESLRSDLYSLQGKIAHLEVMVSDLLMKRGSE
jgi:hypothetical protein